MLLIKGLLHTLFPDRCVGCARRGSYLCVDCTGKIPPAMANSHAFITSVFAYQDFRIKRLVWLLKYRNVRHVAEIFAPALAGALSEFLGEEGVFIGARTIALVPIPLSRKRRKKRGYNQAELIAVEMLKKLSCSNVLLEKDLLAKIIETTPQADIKKKNMRLSNLGDCFAVAEGRRGNGEVVILIDDVTTTGATLVAARRVLRAAGFNKVYALTIGH